MRSTLRIALSIVAIILTLSITATGKEIPFPTDPPDISKYSGSDVDIWWLAQRDYTVPFITDAGSWLQLSEASLQTPAILKAGISRSLPSTEQQAQYEKSMNTYWYGQTAFYVRLRSAVEADLENAGAIIFSLEDDRGNSMVCAGSSSFITQKAIYDASEKSWYKVGIVTAATPAPQVIKEGIKWLRLHVQVGENKGYFQFDFAEPHKALQATTSVEKTTNADFRNTRWGMTKSEVIAAETETKLTSSTSETDLLIGFVTVAGMDAVLYYEFGADGLLRQAVYSFRAEHTNDNLYIEDFNRLKGLLTSKYGAPAFDKPLWKNDFFRDHPDGWGLAVSRGDVTFGATWNTASTEITLLLYGDNYKVSHNLYYVSSKAKPEAKNTSGL